MKGRNRRAVRIVAGAAVTLAVLAMLAGCASLFGNDPVKTTLLGYKNTLMGIREYMIRENIAGRVPDEKLAAYRVQDMRATTLYQSIVTMYTGQKTPDIEAALRSLETMVLDLERQYYTPGK